MLVVEIESWEQWTIPENCISKSYSATVAIKGAGTLGSLSTSNPTTK